jgi:tetratricopeptide (TPR) repeat protein
MLEDAKDLQPRDPNIAKQLEAGRQRLADALVQQAQMYQAVELRMTRNDEKQAILRLAMEGLNRALEQVPEHQKAKDTLEQVKQRLAQLHEQQGDQLAQQAEQGNLEQQTQDLSQALDHFQQAGELQPQQPQLQQKAQRTQKKLEGALQKLADQMMSQQPGESMEEQAARLESALQALNELQGLKPSPKTGEQARQVGGMLEALRQMMASGSKPGGRKPNPNGPPQPTGTNDTDMVVTPMDAPPRLDTPGARGRYRSSALNRSLRDY